MSHFIRAISVFSFYIRLNISSFFFRDLRLKLLETPLLTHTHTHTHTLYRFLNPFPGIVSSQYYLVKNNEILLQKKWTQWISLFHRAFFNSIMDKTPTWLQPYTVQRMAPQGSQHTPATGKNLTKNDIDFTWIANLVYFSIDRQGVPGGMWNTSGECSLC